MWKRHQYFFSLTIAITLLLSAHCPARTNVSRFVRENAQAVRSLNFDEPFTELECIGQAIGDARIVMLGEQSHGDGSTFLAKSRLLKYLHEVKGFEILAFESDFYALTAGWSSIPKDSVSIRRFLKPGDTVRSRLNGSMSLMEYSISAK